MKDFRMRLAAFPAIRCFNASYLNKWAVHCRLAEVEALRPYLPETRLLNAGALADMLPKYPVLFAKPAEGSQGKGIIRIEHRAAGIAYTLYRAGKHTGRAGSTADWLRKTRRARRGWRYILQQGIPLARYEGCHFDIRVILQCNGQGEWKLVKNLPEWRGRAAALPI